MQDNTSCFHLCLYLAWDLGLFLVACPKNQTQSNHSDQSKKPLVNNLMIQPELEPKNIQMASSVGSSVQANQDWFGFYF